MSPYASAARARSGNARLASLSMRKINNQGNMYAPGQHKESSHTASTLGHRSEDVMLSLNATEHLSGATSRP